MPTRADLVKIAQAIYKGNPSISSSGTTNNLTYESGTATSLGLPEPSFVLWSGEEYSEYDAYRRYFNPTYAGYRNYGRYKSGLQAICLGD